MLLLQIVLYLINIQIFGMHTSLIKHKIQKVICMLNTIELVIIGSLTLGCMVQVSPTCTADSLCTYALLVKEEDGRHHSDASAHTCRPHDPPAHW